MQKLSHPQRRTRISNLPRHPLAEEGNQLYVEVKAHIGVESQTKVILAATPANVHDSMCLPNSCLFPSSGKSVRVVPVERQVHDTKRLPAHDRSENRKPFW
jgi:hypothetical protein